MDSRDRGEAEEPVRDKGFVWSGGGRAVWEGRPKYLGPGQGCEPGEAGHRLKGQESREEQKMFIKTRSDLG